MDVKVRAMLAAVTMRWSLQCEEEWTGQKAVPQHWISGQ